MSTRHLAALLPCGLLPLLAACIDGGTETATVPAPASSKLAAQIRYTALGVPHVLADSFKSAGYGYGYAFARDNLCVLAEEIVTLRGERARHFGATGSDGRPIGYLAPLGGVVDNATSDFFYRLVITPERIAAMRAGAGTATRDAIAGYVAGYNRYLRDARAEGSWPPECRQADWVAPLAEADIYARLIQVNLVGGMLALIPQIATAQPPQPVQATIAAGDTGKAGAPDSPELLAASSIVATKSRQRASGIGSNGIALGRDLTAAQTGLLLGNPHFPWWGALRLHQVQLSIPGVYNVNGATLYGLPVPLIGFNQNLAWTHQFAPDARFTLAALKLDPADPTRYLVDGKAVAMTPVPLTISARQPDGSQRPLQRTLYTTQYGPLLADDAFAWTRSTAYAIQDATLDNVRIIDQVILNGQANSAEELRRALATYSALPWVNTLAADRGGNTLFADYSVAPNLPDAQWQRCLHGPLAQQALATAGLVVIDGSDPACRWTGALPAAARPSILRTDYLVNANDSHWIPHAAVKLAGFPAIIAPGPLAEGTQLGERTRSTLALVVDRARGADGLPGNRFTLGNLQQLYLQNRFYKAERWLDEFVDACLATPQQATPDGTVNLTEACAVLRAWNKRHTPTSAGAVLFQEFYRQLNELYEQPGAPSYWRLPFDPANPVTTPDGYNPANRAPLEVLARLVVQFKAADIPLHEIPARRQQIVRNGATYAMPGGRYTSFNWQGTPNAQGIRSDPAFGNSYLQFVTFDANGPVAEGVLAYSQSAQPSSPHHVDQTALYAAGKWAALPYTEAQIAADPDFRVVRIAE